MSGIPSIFGQLTEPITKLIDCVSKGIGVLYEPTRIRREAEANKYELEIMCQAIRDNSDVLAVYDSGKVKAQLPDFAGLYQRATQREQFCKMREQHNIESIIEKAYCLLKDEKTVSDEPVDEDWITKFFEYARDISREEMQIVWAKILAEEIKAPGVFSLRTLSIIQSISSKEAQVFQKILPYILMAEDEDDEYGIVYFICANSDILGKHGIVYNDLIMLNESGLLSLHNHVGLTLKSGEGTYNRSHIIIPDKRKDSLTCRIDIYPLTKAAKELFNVLEVESNLDYLKDVCDNLYTDVFHTTQIAGAIYTLQENQQHSPKHEEKPIYVTQYGNSHDQL